MLKVKNKLQKRSRTLTYLEPSYWEQLSNNLDPTKYNMFTGEYFGPTYEGGELQSVMIKPNWEDMYSEADADFNSGLDWPTYTLKNSYLLTNADKATGARTSDDYLDIVADAARAAGIPVMEAVAIMTKENTLNNPTTKNKDGTKTLHILNEGDEGVIFPNYIKVKANPYMTELSASLKEKKSHPNWDMTANLKYNWKRVNKLAKKQRADYEKYGPLGYAFKDYHEHPGKYNPDLTDYVWMVNNWRKVLLNSPEIQRWLKAYIQKYNLTDKEIY